MFSRFLAVCWPRWPPQCIKLCGWNIHWQWRHPVSTAASSGHSEFNYRAYEDELFATLSDGQNVVALSTVLRQLKDTGLRRTDPRLVESMSKMSHLSVGVRDAGDDVYLDRSSFKQLLQDNIVLLRKAFNADLVIPDFTQFCAVVDELYWQCRSNTSGNVSTYLPLLASQKPSYWSVSVCSVDGQRHCVGDSDVMFSLQSGCHPLNYALAVNELGDDVVKQFVGHEPTDETISGTVRLDASNKPVNSILNAGALVIASLMRLNQPLDVRFDTIVSDYTRLAGGENVDFNNALFLSERQVADHNYAMGYMLRHHKCFAAGVDLHEVLDLYFQLGSLEITTDNGAVIAGTLANGGYCPITGEQVLSPAAVRNTLSLMHSCGMYRYSGGFAFSVGLPSKSSVSGLILLVVPNLLGLCLYSPPLDQHGNSVRGVQFCQQLVHRFQFHHYDTQRHSDQQLYDPRLTRRNRDDGQTVNALFAASTGDLRALRHLLLEGVDLSAADYDGRTALHVAAAGGQLDAVKFLVDKCPTTLSAKDRWGQTALTEAIQFGHRTIAEYLQHKADSGRL